MARMPAATLNVSSDAGEVQRGNEERVAVVGDSWEREREKGHRVCMLQRASWLAHCFHVSAAACSQTRDPASAHVLTRYKLSKHATAWQAHGLSLAPPVACYQRLDSGASWE